MPKKSLGLVAALVAAVPILAGCSVATAHDDPPPVTVRSVPGSDAKQVRLTERAVERLGIATEAVREQKVTLNGKNGTHEVIPYSAVIYDNDGSTWTFVRIGARTYLRERITVASIDGSVAVLTQGPAPGAAVVTVGAPELLGTEYNISGEE
jgi:hypothetical protein